MVTDVKEMMDQTLARMQLVVDIVSKAMQEGKPEEIPNRYKAAFSADLERIRPHHPVLFKHINETLIPKLWSRISVEQYRRHHP